MSFKVNFPLILSIYYENDSMQYSSKIFFSFRRFSINFHFLNKMKKIDPCLFMRKKSNNIEDMKIYEPMDEQKNNFWYEISWLCECWPRLHIHGSSVDMLSKVLKINFILSIWFQVLAALRTLIYLGREKKPLFDVIQLDKCWRFVGTVMLIDATQHFNIIL